MKKLIFFAAMLFAAVACDLYESPQSSVTKDNLFASESGLKMYTYSMYGALPSGDWPTWGNSSSNYMNAYQGRREFLMSEYNADMQGQWSWGTLRNINYFLDNNKSEAIDQKTRDNYNGIARFWRAHFYFQKVRDYWDVPWIDHTLDIDDELLFAPQNSRDEVCEHIYEDLQFAINNISEKKNSTATTVTSLVAAGYQSRFCLWVGTFLKYQRLSGAEKWLERAAAAAKIVMDSKQFSLNTAGATPYRDLFVTKTPIGTEVMMAKVFSQAEGLVNGMNRRMTASTLGTPYAPVRQYMNLYLNLDGSRYTDNPKYKTDEFMHEFDGRDKRIAQTVRVPGTKRSNGAAYPDWQVTYTGYMGLKFCTDDADLDGKYMNENNYVFMRYAEILINYAEAKAELGTLTDAEWEQTIGAVRKRAGITGGLDKKPTVADKYMQENWFPGITDPVILEARREHMLELVWEDCPGPDADLQRWHIGPAYGMKWQGIYVKEFNTNIDLDLDGTPDVFFYTDESKKPAPEGHVVYQYVPLTKGNSHWTVDEDGHTLVFGMKDEKVVWNDRCYVHPVSTNDIALNPNLVQNSLWK